MGGVSRSKHVATEGRNAQWQAPSRPSGCATADKAPSRRALSAFFETALRSARLAGAIPELATSSSSAARSAADSSRASGMAERAVVKSKPMAPRAGHVGDHEIG